MGKMVNMGKRVKIGKICKMVKIRTMDTMVEMVTMGKMVKIGKMGKMDKIGKLWNAFPKWSKWWAKGRTRNGTCVLGPPLNAFTGHMKVFQAFWAYINVSAVFGLKSWRCGTRCQIDGQNIF